MLGAIEVRLSVVCEACDQALPINGPVPQVKCTRCMEVTRLDGDRYGWPRLLRAAFAHAVRTARDASEQRVDKPEMRVVSRPRWPACSGCGQDHEARRVKLALMKDQPVRCGCGVEHALQPVPAAFQAVFPYVRGVFDADVPNDTPGPAAPAKTAPVVMACMACAAALPIDGAHRLVACAYCNASNYLPDDLWLALHPAIKREAWFVVFDEDDVLTALGR
jgi:hypothetical protein